MPTCKVTACLNMAERKQGQVLCQGIETFGNLAQSNLFNEQCSCKILKHIVFSFVWKLAQDISNRMQYANLNWGKIS